PNGGSVGNENTFANVLSKKPVPMSNVIDSQPVIVLDDDCVQSQDLTLSLMGKVKEFASLTNIKSALCNEGFTDLNIRYLGEFWVLLEFKSLKVRDLFCENVGVKSWFSEITPASVDFCPDGRIVWVDVEGVPFKFWTANTFSRIAARWGKMLESDDIDENCYHSRRLCIYTKIHSNIFENFKIVFKGKVFWLRAKEVPGWEPEFLEIDDEEERSDKASMEEDEFIGNFSDKDEEVSETVFENASGTKQNASGTKVNVSEDPFGIYSILNKKNAVNAANEVTDSHSIPHPPGFTPVQEKACEDNDENIEHSKSNSGSKEEEAIREDLNSMSDKGGSVNMGRFKTTEAPRSGGSFLSLMEDVVKVGVTMGYNMDGVVRFKSDRFGSIFNEKGADEFNSFIANSGLEEVPLGGCNFTWCHKSAAKMSKLDRFLVSNNLFTYCPHISAITLDRFLSDHRPILLRETSFDYGPVPFRFFQYWIEIDGFSKFIEDTWNLAPVSGTNALCVLISKMKFLKNRIREWINVSRVKTNGDIQCFKEELRVFDEVIDKGEGSDTILTKRLELINDIKRIEQLKAKEMAQKSKIKWAIEGDENSRFFHVKREFFNHFRDRFANSKDTRITINMTFPKQISNDQKEDLERALSKDELKAAVWDCGTDNGIIPKGGNPSFITLIPKIPAANLVKDFRPICLIGSIYKIIAKILANRLVGVLDNIVHEVQSAFISGSILVNGSPTKEFQFCKGLKQGDPLSPFLFILIMESLHLSFQRVVDSGMFKGLNLSNSMCLSHMFYADDVVFVGKWSDENINTLTNVLECFHRASGLKINMSKSKIMGVNVDENKVNLAASKLGCLSLYSPFSYLGTKVGDMMSRAQAWKEVVDKVKNRLSKWKMKALSIGGRLTLLKSVLGSIPIFHMSIFRVPLTVLQMLESLRGHFFNGHEIGSNKATWVKWEKVLTAKDKGGLGVASLYALNRGLLVKWFWRFYNQETSLWKKVIQAIHGRDGNVHSINKSAVHSCWTTIVKEIRRLGSDNWYHGGILKDIYPRLYALENRKDITVSSKLADPHLNTSFRRDIRGGCEMEQFQMLVDLVDLLITICLPLEERVGYGTEGSSEFFVTVNALPTRYNLSRRGMDIQSLSCPMCDCGIESTDHVFVGCDVSRQLGRMISNWWNTPLVEMDTIAVWKTWFSSIRLAPNFKSIFEGV
ncbi:RNA-directed DNA polymerase, eukaryota, partial [Tanacetum coccineum]